MIRGPAFGLVCVLFISTVFTQTSYGTGATFELEGAIVARGAESCARNLNLFTPPTLPEMRRLSIASTALVERSVPRTGFDVIEEQAKVEQIADYWAPRALRECLGKNVGFVSTPAPTSPDPASIGVIDHNNSFPLHIDTRIENRVVSTTAYVTMPGRYVPGEYVFGDRFQLLQVHLHGGGTPTASGKNGLDLGEAILPTNVGMLSIDLPGHGRGTKDISGLETMDKQIDYILGIIDTVAAPGVKISISGHSWGAEFVVAMWRRSNEPRFARIIEFLALSPPADTSSGGDVQKKLDFEEYWNEHFGDAENISRMAPSDLEFMRNLLQAGKDSDVGTTAPFLSDLHYSLPPITWAEMQTMKRITIVMGKQDGICYVGREKCFADSFPPEMFMEYQGTEDFDKTFGDINRPSRFVFLDRGQTFKGVVDTGHQVFDYIIPGTAVGKSQGDRFITRLMKLSLTAHNGGQEYPLKQDGALDPSLDYAFRAYARDLSARKLLEHVTEFVKTTSYDHDTFLDRQYELENYLSKLESIRREEKSFSDARVLSALNALSSQLGLGENLKVSDARRKVESEPPSPERRLILEKYLGERKAIEDDMLSNWVDEESEAKFQALFTAQADLLARQQIANPREYQKRIAELKSSRDPAQRPDRERLGRYHEEFQKIVKAREINFGKERNARIAKLSRPEGIATDSNAAQRELNAETDPARREAFKRYVAQAPATELAARDSARIATQQKLIDLAKPKGTGSEEDVRAAIVEHKKKMGLVYAPPGHQEIEQTVKAIEAADQRIVNADGMARDTHTTRQQRMAKIKIFTNSFKNTDVTSEKLKPIEYHVELALAAFYKSYRAYESAKSRHMIYLYKHDMLTGAEIYKWPNDVLEARAEYKRDKKAYLDLIPVLTKTRRHEALEGHLVSEKFSKAAEAAMQAARSLWGEPTIGKDGQVIPNLSESLNSAEEALEETRKANGRAEFDLGYLRSQYIEQMRNAGQMVPFNIKPTAIAPLFAESLRDLTVDLETDSSKRSALELFRARYQLMHHELSQMNQGPKDSGY